MLINLLIGAIIFGYAGYTLFKFVKKSKKGKCATCSLNKSCAAACSDVKGEQDFSFPNYNK